jgi:hypothetical protein
MYCLRSKTLPERLQIIPWLQNKLTRHSRVLGIWKKFKSEKENVVHALYMSPCVWTMGSNEEGMRLTKRCWSYNWTTLMVPVLNMPCHMVDNFLHITWRSWYAWNELAHNKPLPPKDARKGSWLTFLICYGILKLWWLMRSLKGRVSKSVPHLRGIRRWKRNHPINLGVDLHKVLSDRDVSFHTTDGSTGSRHGSSWWSGYYYLHSMTVSE